MSRTFARPGTTPTQREIAVLKAYLVGGSYKAAAKALGITPGTARQHAHNLMTRIRARNVAEAIHQLRDQLPA